MYKRAIHLSQKNIGPEKGPIQTNDIQNAIAIEISYVEPNPQHGKEKPLRSVPSPLLTSETKNPS